MAKLGKTVGKSHEDKALMYYYKAVEYFENNKKRVYQILTAITVVIVLLIIYFRYQSSKNDSATLEYAKAKQFYLSGDYQQAISGDSLGTSRGLQYLVETYGSTESGEAAKIMLANSYYYMRDFDKAEKYYKDFSGGNESFKAAALAGQASVFEARNNFAEAAKLFEKASKVSKNVSNSDEYLFSALRNYYNANDNDNLKKSIKSLKSDYPKSKYIAQIARYDKGE